MVALYPCLRRDRTVCDPEARALNIPEVYSYSAPSRYCPRSTSDKQRICIVVSSQVTTPMNWRAAVRVTVIWEGKYSSPMKPMPPVTKIFLSADDMFLKVVEARSNQTISSRGPSLQCSWPLAQTAILFTTSPPGKHSGNAAPPLDLKKMLLQSKKCGADLVVCLAYSFRAQTRESPCRSQTPSAYIGGHPFHQLLCRLLFDMRKPRRFSQI